MKISPARLAPFLAFFLSGASSLIFQTIWARMLHHVFGAAPVAISTVLSVFMGGLGLGAWLGGRYASRIKNPLLAYAVAEVLVGFWGLLIPLLVPADGWLADVNGALRDSLGGESSLFMVARFLCVVPILLVPTTLMGSTLPLLTQHFVARDQGARAASAQVGGLYAINTFGAATGPLLSSFLLMPMFGLSVTNIVACSMNFGLAALIWFSQGMLLKEPWKPGQPLGIWPGSAPIEEARAEPEAPPDDDPIDAPVPALMRYAALFAFGASGAAALSYEVVLSRALAMTVGSSIYSFALILETFLIGIAVGAAVMSALLSKGRGPLTGIGVLAALMVLLANIPWAIDITDGSTEVAGSWFNYGLMTVLFLLPIALARAWAETAARQTEGWSELRAGSGFLTPALSMIAMPYIAASITYSYFPGYFPKIVASVVAVVATFLLIGTLARRSPPLLIALVQLFIAGAMVVAYVWQDEVPFAFVQLVQSISEEALPSHVGTVQFFTFLTAALCTFPATLGMGAMFPLTLRLWTSGGSGVARDVGYVYPTNTIGSLVGAWLPGFVLFSVWGMERTLHAGIYLNMAVALLLLIAGAADDSPAPAPAPAKGKKAKAAVDGPVRTGELPLWHSITVYILAPLIPALLTLFVFGTRSPSSPLRWDQAHMTLGVFRVSLARQGLADENAARPELEFYQDGLTTTVSVERWGEHVALKNNGKVDASNGDDMPTQVNVAAYPLLLHPTGPEDLDVAIVGFGSGVSVGTALDFPVRRVDVIELERSIPLAARSFDEENGLAYTSAEWPYIEMDRLSLINDDGRNYLASTRQMYDVIISEPSNPWITGVSDLFTVDHFRITKRRLRDGGIYCQWVQLYELSPENIKTIFRTFASQFDHVLVLSADHGSPDTVMLGSNQPMRLDIARLQAGFEMAGPAARLEQANLDNPYDIVARTLFASRDEVLRYSQIEERRRSGGWTEDVSSDNADSCDEPDCRRRPAVLNTDDNARIEFRAPRDLIGFSAYDGYLRTIYSQSWPWGNPGPILDGIGDGDARARHYAELAMSLVAHGRYQRAGDFIEAAEEAGRAQETAIALEVLTLLLSGEHEPTVRLETPTPPPSLDGDEAREFLDGFEDVRSQVEEEQYGAALLALESIPAPLRRTSQPLRYLYGYLLYKAADGRPSDIRAAITHLGDLVREQPDYVLRHPEIYYYLARAHDADASFPRALRSMRTYVEARLGPAPDDEVAPEPPRDEAPVTDAPGESPKDEHPYRG